MVEGDTNMTAQESKKEYRKKRGGKLLLFAGVFFVIYLILYATTGGGPTSLLVGAVMGLFSLGMIICLVAGIIYLIAGLAGK
jgi:hypothetical protein